MPHFLSASVEEHCTSMNLVSFELSHSASINGSASCSVPFRLLRKAKSCGPENLTQLVYLRIPSPPLLEDVLHNEASHYAQADGAVDLFPFPLHPGPIIAAGPSGGAESYGDQRTRKKRFSAEAAYLTPPPSPDRYISSRCTPQSSSQSFRLNKSPNNLSSPEKLLRRESATPDPFGSLSPRRVREASRLTSGSGGRPANQSRSGVIGSADMLGLARNSPDPQARNASAGAIWNIGGIPTPAPGPVRSISDGRGGLTGSGTNAPMYSSRFFEGDTPDQDLDRLEGRLALALEIDQASRVLSNSRSPEQVRSASSVDTGTHRDAFYVEPRTLWKDGGWLREGKGSVLDAPRLRDDYYCSILAYCHTCRTLAVGLQNKVYLWSEIFGVRYPELDPSRRNTYVTSLSFSSTQGGHGILATGCSDGLVSLWSLHDKDTRFRSQQSNAISCLAFKPVTTRRQSERFGTLVATEELLVGDELGVISYYSIEWLNSQQVNIHGWDGAMALLAKISVHEQQICGLAWSPDGDYFATGGNDNACCLFEVRDILAAPEISLNRGPLQAMMISFGIPHTLPSPGGSHTITGNLGRRLRDAFLPQEHQSFILPADDISFTKSKPPSSQHGVLEVGEGRQKHRWLLSAAVKAIAFCPWQRGLLAIGGGSNDRAIHFYHTFSGACLATINVQAQVTSLIWSTSRREIAATLGYAQPEHPYRIVIFSWPDCRQVVAIPWASEMRALFAIPYPGGPNQSSRLMGEGVTWWSRTAEEGCIVVASSDESVKFHEVWSGGRKSTGGNNGLLGGSDILEGLEGIDKESGDIIR